MAITIREAVLQDLPGILSLYSVYIMETTHTFEYVVPSLDSFRERFESITEQFPWLVCEVDGELAGYAYASAAFKRAAYQWDADLAVYLDSRGISDISDLKGLTELRTLSLRDNKIEDITPIASLINIRDLILSGNKIKEFDTFTNLKRINCLVGCMIQ